MLPFPPPGYGGEEEREREREKEERQKIMAKKECCFFFSVLSQIGETPSAAVRGKKFRQNGTLSSVFASTEAIFLSVLFELLEKVKNPVVVLSFCCTDFFFFSLFLSLHVQFAKSHVSHFPPFLPF